MAYTGSFAITSINGDSVTQAGVYFVGREYDLGSGSAFVTGTYTGDVPVSMTGQCGTGLIITFSSFEASGGVWSGDLTFIPPGTSLSLIATNSLAEQSTPLVMANFGCGDFGIIAGQSNALGQVLDDFNSSGDLFPAAHIVGSIMFRFDSATSTFKLEVPRRDYHLTRALSFLSRKLAIPFCAVNVAIGSTKIDTWTYPNGSSWLSAEAVLNSARVLGSRNVPTVLWWQGESDRLTSIPVYKGALLQMVADMRSQWVIKEVLAVPVIYSLAQNIADATLEVATGGETYLYVACCTSDLRSDAPDYGNDVHLQRVSEAEIIGDRIGQTLIWRAGYPSPSIGVGDRNSLVRYLLRPAP